MSTSPFIAVTTLLAMRLALLQFVLVPGEPEFHFLRDPAQLIAFHGGTLL
jgi:hypothetical protein